MPEIVAKWRWRRQVRFEPVAGSFAVGVLAAIGFDPKAILVEATIETVTPYLQFMAWAVALAIGLYTLWSSLDNIKRAFRAFRKAGALGVLAVFAALAAGFTLVHNPWTSLILLAAAAFIWYVGSKLR